MDKILLEVCCGSVDDAVEAQKAGAGRVELNSNIFYGGLTPSIGSVIQAKKILDIPVMVMIRPRGGGFCYTDTEFEIMKNDAEEAIKNGADGLVFGCLTADGNIDTERNKILFDIAGNKDTVFHRAIDVVKDPFATLDVLVKIGVKRVLTAGQNNTPEAGAEMIKKLMKYAKDRIEILPGGATPYNIEGLVSVLNPKQVHMAAFKTVYDHSCRHKPDIYFGLALYPPEDRYDLTDGAVVGKVKDYLKR